MKYELKIRFKGKKMLKLGILGKSYLNCAKQDNFEILTKKIIQYEIVSLNLGKGL